MTEIEAPRFYPTRRYRNTARMLDWLEQAFGFSRHYVVEGEDGGIAHAQIAFGSSMLMLGDHRDDDFGKTVGEPESTAGGQSIYVAVDDAKAAHDRAKAAGAKITVALNTTFYGSHEFGCLDPEGQYWHFGTFWPKAHETPDY